MKCVLCNNKIKGFGNNAEPLAEGCCCDLCNIKVVESRLLNFYLSSKTNGKYARDGIMAFNKSMLKSKSFKTNDLIYIYEMEGEIAYSHKVGRIDYVDDAGNIHGSWGGLSLLVDKDVFYVADLVDSYITYLTKGGD